jgi:hypothetical protein
MEKIIFDLKKKLESYSLPEGLEIIPSYASLKASKDEFTAHYSKVVMNYNRICDSLSALQYTTVTIDHLLRELPNIKEVWSKQKLISAELKNLKDDYIGMMMSYKYAKEGLEAAVKFYNNMNYVLTSMRMEEV